VQSRECVVCVCAARSRSLLAGVSRNFCWTCGRGPTPKEMRRLAWSLREPPLVYLWRLRECKITTNQFHKGLFDGLDIDATRSKTVRNSKSCVAPSHNTASEDLWSGTAACLQEIARARLPAVSSSLSLAVHVDEPRLSVLRHRATSC
jgi:hypothetical protein